ncbi:hypothetical protein FQA39_LY09432 [Lamprigera yunnana]|nr:hypothetical protein FQA39_LY09432 [Lamprigera yunnana]
MENYMNYDLMGSMSQVRMKLGCIPTKFACQLGRKTGTYVERQYIRKKRKMMAIEECEKQLEESNRVTEHFDFEDIASGSSVQHNLEQAQHVTSKMIDKSIQVHMTKTFRSKGNQIRVRLVNQMTSSLKPQLHSASTSPFKIKHNVNSNSSILTEQSDSDISYTPSVTHTESSLSTKLLQMESASDCSEMIEDDKKREDLRILECKTCNLNVELELFLG